MSANIRWFAGGLVGLIATAMAGQDATPAAPTSKPPQFQLEVEIVRGEQLSWIRVYLRNRTDEAIRFRTGAAGGPGGLDDGYRVPGYEAEPVVSRDPEHRWIVGSPPQIVPVLTFGYGEAGYITLTPPCLGGPTRRAGTPAVFEVPADGRRLYTSFAVPSLHVQGKFVMGAMELRSHAERPALSPCTELIEVDADTAGSSENHR